MNAENARKAQNVKPAATHIYAPGRIYRGPVAEGPADHQRAQGI